MRCSAVLLAAGRSERMGAHKALLSWDGTTLLDYQLRQLAAHDVSEIVVVTGHAAELLARIIDAAPKARRVHSAAYDLGKAGSVRAGVAAIDERSDTVLLLAVDQPRPASLIARLLEAHQRAHAIVTAPAFEGHRGHPLIFDRSLLPELLAVDDASLGVRAVVERHAAELQLVPVTDAIACLDLNTPEDVERGERLLRDGGAAAARGGKPQQHPRR